MKWNQKKKKGVELRLELCLTLPISIGNVNKTTLDGACNLGIYAGGKKRLERRKE